MRVNSQQNNKNVFLFSKKLILLCLLGLIAISPISILAQNKTFTVVLDPGHGGKDPGTIGTKRYKTIFEKDIVLSVALKVGALLEKEMPNVKVIYTRKTDVFVELHKRGEIANKADADLFISIHINAATPTAKGTETYVLGVHRNESNLAVAKMENDVILLESNYEKHYAYNPNDPSSIIGLTLMQEDFLDQSIRMAKILEKSFTDIGNRNSKGVKQAGFVVLHQSYMPAILTEIGFLSNKEEEDFLRTEDGQNKIAQSMFGAIKKYKSELDYNNNDPSNIEIIEAENQVESIEQAIDKTETIPIVKENQRIYEGVIFKVQIASSKNNLDTKASNFKGLEGIERVKTGDHFKYYLGKTSNYDEILISREKATSKGYTDCFIVAFKGNERVSVTDVLNSKK
jgi:N-acetylmuramoyl-L-alanine amidase